MIAPPTSIRLIDRRDAPRGAPRPPFGLPSWGGRDASAIAVLLPSHDGGADTSPASILAAASSLPAPSELAPGTLVLLLGSPRDESFVRRMIGARARPIERTLRSSALLCRGYIDIGAGIEEISGHDLVWGFTRGD